jgi:hypothetical protein
MARGHTTAVVLDASDFEKNVGDRVRPGEALGLYERHPVVSPFEARIESISFDSDEHALRIVLEEIP